MIKTENIIEEKDFENVTGDWATSGEACPFKKKIRTLKMNDISCQEEDFKSGASEKISRNEFHKMQKRGFA